MSVEAMAWAYSILLQREHDWLRSAQPRRRRNESRAMSNAEAELEFLNRFRELTR